MHRFALVLASGTDIIGCHLSGKENLSVVLSDIHTQTLVQQHHDSKVDRRLIINI